jgi:predicted dehydrogenase
VKKEDLKSKQPGTVDQPRRTLLGAMGSGIIASAFGGIMSGAPQVARSQEVAAVRWGFVGTGSIANSMARVVQLTPAAELAAVSSRKMASAEAFAGNHGAGKAFDSWAEMAAWDGVDAIYVATPTSVREEICVAAAKQGKHVLGEKPFASLSSLERITAACRENSVGFMDGTHFVHHPRTAAIQSGMAEKVGWPWSVDSAFQFSLKDRNNIRFNPMLEPLGAIGDAGWYNMRAAVEYLSPGIELRSLNAYLRRDAETGAAIGGGGILVFEDESTSTWNCGFDSGAVIMDLRISGARGSISVDDFLSQDRDASASYLYRSGGWGPNAVAESVRIESSLPGAALMFEDFAALVRDEALRERWIRASERTQRLLDAVWYDALKNE